MGIFRFITLSLYGASIFTWKFLPAVGALIGFLLFAPPEWFGAAMAALLALAGHLSKQAARQLFPRPDSHGSARFADLDDARHGCLLGQKGQILGRKSGRMLRYNGDGHLLTFAPTRSGKGVGCVIPNLLVHRGSVVVTDIKGENSAIAGAWRRTLGSVYEVAPLGGATGPTATFNPVDFIRAGAIFEVDDARLIAEMLVIPEHAQPNHWEREARTLITGLLLYMRYHRDAMYQNLGTLRDILMVDADEFELILAEMAASHHPNAARIAQGFSQKEPKERSAVISTAQGATELFESPELRAATEVSSFSFESLKDETAGNTPIFSGAHKWSLSQHRQFLSGGDTTQSHVGSFIVIRPKPPSCKRLDLLNRVKQVMSQPVITNRSVVALNVGILLRLPWPDILKLNATTSSPLR